MVVVEVVVGMHRSKAMMVGRRRQSDVATVGGGLGPPLRNLEGNPRKRGPMTGETDKEG